jgi:hypothetical protein
MRFSIIAMQIAPSVLGIESNHSLSLTTKDSSPFVNKFNWYLLCVRAKHGWCSYQHQPRSLKASAAKMHWRVGDGGRAMSSGIDRPAVCARLRSG